MIYLFLIGQEWDVSLFRAAAVMCCGAMGMLVCSSFVSLCMFTVSKALLMSSPTVMVHAGEPYG